MCVKQFWSVPLIKNQCKSLGCFDHEKATFPPNDWILNIIYTVLPQHWHWYSLRYKEGLSKTKWFVKSKPTIHCIVLAKRVSIMLRCTHQDWWTSQDWQACYHQSLWVSVHVLRNTWTWAPCLHFQGLDGGISTWIVPPFSPHGLGWFLSRIYNCH